MQEPDLRFRAVRGLRQLKLYSCRIGPHFPLTLAHPKGLSHLAARKLVSDLPLYKLSKQRRNSPIANPFHDGYTTRTCMLRFRAHESQQIEIRAEKVSTQGLPLAGWRHLINEKASENSLVPGYTIHYPESLSQDSYIVQVAAQEKVLEVVKAEAQAIIPPLAFQFAQTLRLPITRVNIVSKVESYWGLCTSRNELRFSDLAILLPNDLLRYLILHELAHVTHKNHASDFWILLSRYVGGNPKAINRRLRNIALPLPILY